MSAWREHIKKTMKENPTLMLKDVLKLASKTYKSTAATLKHAAKASKKSTLKTVKGVKKSLGLKSKSAKKSKKSKSAKKSKKSKKSKSAKKSRKSKSAKKSRK